MEITLLSGSTYGYFADRDWRATVPHSYGPYTLHYCLLLLLLLLLLSYYRDFDNNLKLISEMTGSN